MHSNPVPRKLLDTEVSKAIQLCKDASREDPLFRYLYETSTHWQKWQLEAGEYFSDSVRKGLMWTVGDVDAVMICVPTNEAVDRIDQFEDMVGNEYSSEEQRKRYIEYGKKAKRAIDETIGDRVNEMIVLDLIATLPEKQGRGYGSALAKVVTEKADSEGREAWLISSTATNTGFYGYHGFFSKNKIILGDDNPSWDNHPVVIDLMVRKPQSST